jgi:hypothetical protein
LLIGVIVPREIAAGVEPVHRNENFLQEVKSFITQPSPGLTLKQPGLCETSGVAYSGTGRIAKVAVSADGGQSWAETALQREASDAVHLRVVLLED